MKRSVSVYDEAGFTTVGMVLALLITLALIFSAGQVCRVNAAASEIQNVADAAALAAQNEVAEFMIIVYVCDAIVLSLSLTSLVVTGLGVVALCTTVTAPAADVLLNAGHEIAHARNTFAEKAAAGLNTLQLLLPFLAITNAASVASANNTGAACYRALALLSPDKGEPIDIDVSEGVVEIQNAVDDESQELQSLAAETEQAATRMAEIKMRAFEHDCGASPSYCMYERASVLASLAGGSNPFYKSVDAWSFSVALKRAQTYYAYRFANEVPEGFSIEQQARSALRKRFYAYACKTLERGYVWETDDYFEAEFPRLPKNTEEMRESDLYNEKVYPCTVDEKGQTIMHAWEGCPHAAGATSYGSIAQMESGDYRVCDACEFTASSLGKVAAASSSIENGFEYHYNIVAAAAEEYEKVCADSAPSERKLKDHISTLFGGIEEILQDCVGKRIHACPPGSYGVVVLVINTGQESAGNGFANLFVRNHDTLGTRAAISAATLVADPSGEGTSVISSLLDDLRDKLGVAVGISGVVLDCWSGMLQAYTNGQTALHNAVSSSLDWFGGWRAGNLGSWASEKLQQSVKAVGLEPADLDALKPILVNSAHIARSGEGAFFARFLSLKEYAVTHSSESSEEFLSLVGIAEQILAEVFLPEDGKIEIAVIELWDQNGLSAPFEIALPPPMEGDAGDIL